MKVWRFFNSDSNTSILDRLLTSKGFSNQHEKNDFINCNYEISDPSEFYGMSDLVKRLNKAIDSFEKVCIFGDYDCDGITATCMLYSYLSKKNLNVMYMLPSRYEEGYGLTKTIVDKINSYGVNLIITVDNGISAYDEICYSNSLGIDVIVTDHHKIPERLPPAVSIVNPHLNKSGFKDFAGVGVVFKIIQELEKQNSSLDDLLKEYGDLLSIGTIGDMVSMTGENRVLVKKSLKYLRKSSRPGVQVLIEGTVFGSDMDGTEISFGIVPKLNACGRMGSADYAAKLLLSSSISEARTFLKISLDMNDERKSLCNSIIDEVECDIYKNHLYNDRIIFAWNENWNHGVIGIAASVICNKFGKPCFLFSVQKDESRGSARSIPGFDIHNCLSDCKDLVTKFGGHTMAAGANIKTQNLKELKKRLLSISSNIDMPFYFIDISCTIEPEDVSIKILDEINKMSPFGSGNSEPIFAILNICLVKVFSIGSGKHIKIKFRKNDKIFEATMFGMPYSDFLFSPGDMLDLAVRIKKNYFLGNETAVIHIVDVRLSGVDTFEIAFEQRIFEDFISGIKNIPNDCVPSRDDFVKVFNCIKNNFLFNFRVEKLYNMMKKYNIRMSKAFLILEIFKELNIFNVDKRCDNYMISVKSRKKVDLHESQILKKAIGEN